MREISAAELFETISSRKDADSAAGSVLIDIRAEEEYRRGSVPGAVNIPARRFEEDYESCLEELKGCSAVILLDHTGSGSRELAGRLSRSGLDAGVLAGGWRSYLVRQLEAVAAEETPEKLEERRRKAEKSLIKKYRKELWSRFTKAVRDYQLIREGDRVACCISGGKDSFLLAKLLQELQKHGPVPFELIFLTMNPGYNEENWKIIRNNAKILGIPLTVFETRVFDTVAGIEKNPCYLCARMRRGYLYNNARLLGCNKIALGHHYDDVIETILMGMLYAGKIETMLPKLHSQHFEGMELIRPLYLVRESAVKAWRDYNGLHFIQCACRFTEDTASFGTQKESKRAEIKKLIASLAEKEPVIEANIFRSVENINLRTVMAWRKDGESCSFLDDYDLQEDGTELAAMPDKNTMN